MRRPCFHTHALALTLALIAGAGPSRAEPAPKSVEIDRNGVIILIRSTLLALDQANKTGNYTVLRDLGAPGFQRNTSAALGDVFAAQRREGLDLSGVAVLDPQLSLLPQLEPNGLMHMRGFFPSAPKQINFDLLYAPVAGEWKLFGLSVGLGQMGAVAPSPPEPRKEDSKKEPTAGHDQKPPRAGPKSDGKPKPTH